ncbi:hypothetical protein Tco_1286932 [Tanacetum coccineum]
MPMVPPNNVGTDLNGKSVNETQHRGMIGSLMHLTASRFDIQLSTCLCARYQANPKESYLIAIKRIFRYLKGTSSRGLGIINVQEANLCAEVLKSSNLFFCDKPADIFTSPLDELTFKRLIVELVYDFSNYGVTCEDEAKRRNSGTKTKTFEENCYLLLYAVSSKEDTAYQRQIITRICVIINSRSDVSLFTYTPYAQLVISQRYEVNVIDGN